MLALGGADFQDRCYKIETFRNEIKPKMPSGSLPELELADGTFVSGMDEITKVVANEYGFWPEDDALAAECERLVKVFAAFTYAFVKPVFPEFDAAAETKSIMENTLPEYISAVEEVLTRNGTTFLLADKLYACDFFAAKFYVDNLTNEHCELSKLCSDVIEAHPTFKAYGEAFTAANKAYISKGLVNPATC